MPKYGATGVHKIHSYFSTSGGVLTFFRDNASTQIAFGEDGTGVDVKFYGDTASAFVLWDESADTLQGASSAVFAWGGAASFAGVVVMTGSSITIGNASGDTVGFYGKTPAVQAASATAASTVLINLGLMAS